MYLKIHNLVGQSSNVSLVMLQILACLCCCHMDNQKEQIKLSELINFLRQVANWGPSLILKFTKHFVAPNMGYNQ